MSDNLTLPTGSSAGERKSWVLPLGRNGAQTVSLGDATFLGYASTQLSRHVNHPGHEYAPQKVKCPACRWYETRLFRVHGGSSNQHYLVHHLGGSHVPGEVDLCRYEEAFGAHEVVELFTVRPSPDERTDSGTPRTPFLTRPGARLLSQAASHDDHIDDAYVNRAVQ